VTKLDLHQPNELLDGLVPQVTNVNPPISCLHTKIEKNAIDGDQATHISFGYEFCNMKPYVSGYVNHFASVSNWDIDVKEN
jgi:hypothetical protein